MRNPKIGVVSLGCPKNATDTEVMLGLLNEAGFEVTFDNDDAQMLVCIHTLNRNQLSNAISQHIFA